MGIKAVLFDLDGTLLPMDQDVFAKAYVGGLAKTAVPFGYEPTSMVGAILAGTKAMAKNDGALTNEKVFWNEMAGLLGDSVWKDVGIFDEFYRTDFQRISEVCGFEPRAKGTVERVKRMGYRVFLATNPLFPTVATESRIRWAGLEPTDFEGFTTFETSRHCKPNPDYYRDLLDILKLRPEECLMVGNDVDEDMIAESVGMKVFLLTDCMINKSGRDISVYPHGDLDAFLSYLETV